MRLRTFLTALLGVGMAGCASMEHSPDVEVSLANIRFLNATVMETTAEFEVRIENATPETLHLDGGVHKLTLNGLYLGKGMSGDEIQVPRFSSVTQKVEVHLSNLRLATRLRSIVEAQKLDYRLESVLHAVGRRSYSSYREGTLDLTQHGTRPPTP